MTLGDPGYGDLGLREDVCTAPMRLFRYATLITDGDEILVMPCKTRASCSSKDDPWYKEVEDGNANND